ncbi:MAG TPA: 5-(carboxyamino)imidazole ribonucleotide mutase [Candidatus Hydrogenedentes bacterium]|jgi:5-(carboxyamino)imidazole ribonucleotide mutase|nr:MAG: N5-carboxyaminoimidazole ribonucleotide mutase [Candidatus Hydrogenedentes bacterium ADurb.Bin170]HNZ48413.1 5-(carboxyamino)imidazole ribonucleotide mutase [Candidatus Hydrogenedentota bacterium]HOD94901.1 5-(carboxyamino)imidazole ribonucleotide mutase [Candidatus Hydrogenedentota bacterium]HOH41505.1 5-(carboxyamino)imidazole ribonucleotide mutase [Candidatus Hydrogenedentota bacterium]HOM47996.1 5-(carboxyamino)imidazole ribonucleotide mutase [Candidatus Hydrogenedentota bacterium]
MEHSCEKALIAIIMGSESDWETMHRAHTIMKDFGVPHCCRVLSAHRTPDLLAERVRTADANGVEVFIAGAGLSAALPGAIAALTTKPVIGVPIQTGAYNGQDALLAMVQMPPGVPVGATTIGPAGATNAALLAISILANSHPEYREKLQQYREEQVARVAAIKLPCE